MGGGISEEETILGERGKAYNMGVRFNLGDNEPRNTLVHYKTQLGPRTEVVFNESFKLFFSSEQSDELCVYIRDQGVTSSTELGRIKFDDRTLAALIHETEKRQGEGEYRRTGSPGEAAKR